MSNDSTSHSKQKQDYRKDTLCTADIFQEKDCTGFKSLARARELGIPIFDNIPALVMWGQR